MKDIQKIVLENGFELIGNFIFMEPKYNFIHSRTKMQFLSYDFQINLNNDEYYNDFRRQIENKILIYTENFIYGPIEITISIDVNGMGLTIKWSSNQYPKRELII
jgi:hypothetical protein